MRAYPKVPELSLERNICLPMLLVTDVCLKVVSVHVYAMAPAFLPLLYTLLKLYFGSDIEHSRHVPEFQVPKGPNQDNKEGGVGCNLVSSISELLHWQSILCQCIVMVSLALLFPLLFSTLMVDFFLRRLQNLSVVMLVNSLALRNKY